jgi:hypothetical protein
MKKIRLENKVIIFEIVFGMVLERPYKQIGSPNGRFYHVKLSLGKPMGFCSLGKPLKEESLVCADREG